MATKKHKTVLFLCTGNYYRSRYAEILFNSVATRMGLPWRASSRGLALERGIGNVGPIATATLQAVQAMGLRADDQTTRMPMQVTMQDFDAVELVIALKHAEHLPLMQERFPAWVEKIEYWHIDDAPEVLPLIEREVNTLVARILGGGKAPPPEPVPSVSPLPLGEGPGVRAEHSVSGPFRPHPQPLSQRERGAECSQKPMTVKVGRETKGRRGKGVTIVSEIPLDETALTELAATLKQKCGTGGTVKDGRIEIQGDQRDRLTAVLEEMGFKVKRVGG